MNSTLTRIHFVTHLIAFALLLLLFFCLSLLRIHGFDSIHWTVGLVRKSSCFFLSLNIAGASEDEWIDNRTMSTRERGRERRDLAVCFICQSLWLISVETFDEIWKDGTQAKITWVGFGRKKEFIRSRFYRSLGFNCNEHFYTETFSNDRASRKRRKRLTAAVLCRETWQKQETLMSLLPQVFPDSSLFLLISLSGRLTWLKLEMTRWIRERSS